MQMFKICSVTLQPLALILLIESFMKLRLNLTRKKQLKKKSTDGSSPNQRISYTDLWSQCS